MGSQQFLLFVGLTLLVCVSAQTPKPCCTPALFSTGLALLTLQPPRAGAPEQLISQEGMYCIDVKNKRTATNVTVQVLNTQFPTEQVYQIQDFVKKKLYIIVNDQVCQTMPLSGDITNDCIPDNATFRGTLKLGDTPVNRWLIDQSPIRQDVSMTVDKCIPVTSVLTLEQNGLTMVSTEYFNFKPSIDNPDKVFTPPSICNTAESLEVGYDIHRMRRSIFPMHHVPVTTLLL